MSTNNVDGVALPGKIQEEEKEQFKDRQRRRSSIAIPTVMNLRRASTISTESSWCKYDFFQML